MTSMAIRVDRIGKRYRIGEAARRPTSFREAMTRAATAPYRNLKRLRSLSSVNECDEATLMWALRDISFEVAPGEVLGLIGRNGAGKSTLLKILSRITEPTTGHADVWGRVGSLLEVGTGFHPELTGRDNVYLNGAILGMDRRYIRRRFEEIVEFAGIGAFIDTPVKRYSSGMQVRLAFAVAAHLEPDVLIVDEVLAVGDAEFQKKCIGRMDEVARERRTVLFVSHNLGAIQRLCTRAVLLAGGQVVADGATVDVVRQYLATGESEAPPARWVDLAGAHRTGSGRSRFVAVRYGSADPVVEFRPYPAGPLEIATRIHTDVPTQGVTIGFTLRDQHGSTLVSGSTTAKGRKTTLPAGTSTWLVRIPSLPLRPGAYHLDLWLSDVIGIHDLLQPALVVEVFDRQTSMSGPRHDPRRDGPVFFEYQITELHEERARPPESTRRDDATAAGCASAPGP